MLRANMIISWVAYCRDPTFLSIYFSELYKVPARKAHASGYQWQGSCPQDAVLHLSCKHALLVQPIGGLKTCK